jgi:cytochrome c5
MIGLTVRGQGRSVGCSIVDFGAEAMKRILFAALGAWLVANAYAAVPGDEAHGQRLLQANCTGCHDSSVYTRPNRMIHSLDELKHQVEGCGHAAKKEFSSTEVQDLVKHLNDRYYHIQ